MRCTVLLVIAALCTTCFAAGGHTSEAGAWIGSAQSDARVVAVADPLVARALPLQCLLPPSCAGAEPAPADAAPMKADVQPLRIASPPQGPPA